MERAVIFLDRDDTLNVDKSFVHRREDWEFTDRAPDALRDLRAADYALSLVINQSGIGRGYFSLCDVQALHEYVQQCLAEHHIQLDAIAICPHTPDAGCDCRKPSVGLARQIESQLPEPIAYHRSWVIGDKLSDREFGRALGIHVVLLRSHYWRDDQLPHAPTLIADSLYECAQTIIAQLPTAKTEKQRCPPQSIAGS